MSFVFGDTMICDDAESAKLVTFSREVGGVKSVTLDGDVYDPSGTLSGGAAPTGSGILVRVQELLDAERKLGQAQGRLEALEREEQKTRGKREEWRRLAKDVELKEHELALLEQQLAGSSSSRVSLFSLLCVCIRTDSDATQLETDVENAKQTIEALRTALAAAKEKQQQAKDDIKKLERDMDEFKHNKEGKIEELKVRLLPIL
jgi:structural maintenance of chromosome 2